ncbi:hypothetical protein BLNAU_10458 [Blattamonas nauphoetae]|uniref:Uncharacterized protein n=1 Tax=Blattamonas nauphoetae TaxID=2049346 RepID=A0ABQ9XQ98_9EUKA|nr:hypothetical protein BLNAU_10458 [Blattamonas nauphoetae]
MNEESFSISFTLAEYLRQCTLNHEVEKTRYFEQHFMKKIVVRFCGNVLEKDHDMISMYCRPATDFGTSPPAPNVHLIKKGDSKSFETREDGVSFVVGTLLTLTISGEVPSVTLESIPNSSQPQIADWLTFPVFHDIFFSTDERFYQDIYKTNWEGREISALITLLDRPKLQDHYNRIKFRLLDKHTDSTYLDRQECFFEIPEGHGVLDPYYKDESWKTFAFHVILKPKVRRSYEPRRHIFDFVLIVCDPIPLTHIQSSLKEQPDPLPKVNPPSIHQPQNHPPPVYKHETMSIHATMYNPTNRPPSNPPPFANRGGAVPGAFSTLTPPYN